MEIARIYVDGVTAAASRLKQIPEGIIGATIKLTFANDWCGLATTAVFQGVETKDVIVTGNRITIPAECVSKSGHRLRVGFYGVDGETLVIPTVWTDLGTIQDATDPSGDTSTDPTLPVWAQMMDQINDMKKSVNFETDETLTLKDGILSVNTTDQMEQDNTLPITSAGVYATVGNIEALLKTI